MKKLPWGTRNKLSDDEFYGRSNELITIKSILYTTEYANAPEILLTGIRGVGKTVFLNKIKDDLTNEGFLVVLCDFSTSNSYQRGQLLIEDLMKHYYNAIINECANNKLNTITTQINKFFKTKNIHVNDIASVGNVPLPILGATDNINSLIDFVLKLPQQIYENNLDNIKGVIILIDEFQTIHDLNDDMDSFLWTFRGHIQNQNNVGYVLTGSMSIDDQLIYDIASHDGVFGGRMITQQLYPFNKQTVESYLNEKAPYLIFNEDSFNRFFECTNGIPYYVNTLANQLPQDILITKEDIIETFDNNLYYMIKYLFNIWVKLSNKEKDIIIALLDEPIKRVDLSRKVHLKSGSLSKYLTKLSKLGLIENDAGVYSIKELILKRWLKTEYKNNGCYPYRYD